jgi:RNA polymerase sigma factor (sigma-70 family)
MATNAVTWTDEKLIAEIKAGGRRREAAWEQVYRQYAGMLKGIVVKTGGKPEDLEDILGDVFSSVDRAVSKPDFSLHSASFATYLGNSVRNRYLYLRQRIKFEQVEITESSPGVSYSDPARQLILQEALQLVDDTGEICRKMLRMKGEGFDDQEIAGEVGLALQTVKNKLSDCRKRLINLVSKKDLY